MQSNVYVTMSGPALSLLLFENTKAPGYQIGLLLGSLVNQVTDTISDSQMRGEKTETIINISAILPIPSSSHVFNGAGKIDWDKIKEIVESEKDHQELNKSQSLDIVGWYSFKRNVTCKMSMREHVIHQQLSERAREFSQDTSPELFVLCLLYNNLMSKATHVFKHSFMRYLNERKSFELIPLQIHNLGMRQSIQYQITACAPSTASTLRGLFDRLRPNKSGGDLMLAVQSDLQVLLNQKIKELSEVERHRIKSEQEVQDLKRKIEAIQNKHKGVGTAPASSNNNSRNESSLKSSDAKYKQNRPTSTALEPSDRSPETSDTVKPTSPIFRSNLRSRPRVSESPDNARRLHY